MKTRALRNRILVAVAVAGLFVPAAVPAHAVSKEIIQLQTQVQQLMDMVQRLQSTLDTKFAVMQNLAQQTANQAAGVNQSVTALEQKLDAANQAESGKVDAVSGQVQSLNDSVDELKSRIAKLNQAVQNLQSQLQQAQMQNQPNAAGTPGAAPGAGPAMNPGTNPGTSPGTSPAANSGTNPATGAPANPAGGSASPAETGAAPPSGAGAAAAQQAPPLTESYRAALRDYNAGRYQLAASEFGDVVHYYPLDDLAGSSEFYLGEIAYQHRRYNDAITDYNAVIEGFGGNAKAPAAELHKAYALLHLDKRTAGIQELHALIRRHPQTPEAARARERLRALSEHSAAAR